ncbi:MAG: biopolymer transporter ExbD [Candidatus Rokubacteria bacterium]|nr:biopolymer transporter ExbD [Candidatus Rokubacteria bacterium]
MAMSPLSDESGRDDEVVAEINVTPLTDLFLVLLIIFMVTSTSLAQAGLDVNLPKSQTAAGQTPGGVTLTVTADGTLYANDRQTTMAQLPATLKKEFAGGGERVVTIRGDERVVLQTLVQLMDVSRRAGAEKIGVATRSTGS